MTSSGINPLFTAEGATLSSPEQIEHALGELWTQAGAGPETPAEQIKTRVCLANLIVVGHEADAGRLLTTLTDLATAYPTRTIVLLATVAEPPTGVRASVSAVCHLPQPGEQQVCSEQIILRCPLTSGARMEHTVLPLLESDVPVMAWWTVSPRACTELLGVVQRISQRFVFDTGAAGSGSLEPCSHCAVRELGWYRIARWRELLASMFDGQAPEVPGAIEHVTLRCTGPNGFEDAAWIIAFLAGQLGWSPGPQAPRRTGARVSATLHGQRPVDVEFEWAGGPGEGPLHLEITAGAHTFQIRRCRSEADEYELIVCDDRGCDMPRAVQVRPVNTHEALAGAMAGRPIDAAFARAAERAEWLAAE